MAAAPPRAVSARIATSLQAVDHSRALLRSSKPWPPYDWPKAGRLSV